MNPPRFQTSSIDQNKSVRICTAILNSQFSILNLREALFLSPVLFAGKPEYRVECIPVKGTSKNFTLPHTLLRKTL